MNTFHPISRTAHLAMLAAVVACGTWAQIRAAEPIPSETVQAVIAGDWDAVTRTLPDNPDGTTRLLKAHADLAQNRCNRGASALAEADASSVREWDGWTANLARANPASSWAKYLRADALARTGQPGPARALLDEAIASAPANALALNARGVLKALDGDLQGALDDFLGAVEHRPESVLGWTHCAGLALQAKRGARAAVEDANRALRLCPDDALALYHRACLRLIARRFDDAAADLSKAGDVAPELASHLVPARDAALLALSQPEEPRRRPSGFQLTADSPALKEFSAGNLGFGGSKFKQAVKSAQSTHEVNLIVNAATVGANGNKTQLEKVGHLYTQAVQEKNAAGVLAQSTGSWKQSLTVGTGKDSPIKFDVSLGHESASTKSHSAQQQSMANWQSAIKGFDNLQIKSGKTPPGGFDTAQGAVVLDAADWPYLPVYAFFYPARPHDSGRSASKP